MFGTVPSTVLQSMCSRLRNLEGFTAKLIVESNDETLWYVVIKLSFP